MVASERCRSWKSVLKAACAILGLLYLAFWGRLNGLLSTQNAVQTAEAVQGYSWRELSSRHRRESVNQKAVTSQAQTGKTFVVAWEKLLETEQFYVQAHKLAWIRQRIVRMKAFWEKAQSVICKQKPQLCNVNRQRVLVFPGLLTEVSAYDFATNAFKGGYLGELVQWSDLIAALFVLGHDVTIHTSCASLPSVIPKKSDVPFDIIFTDYLGLIGIERQGLFAAVKCRLRVLDSFGTEPEVVFRNSLEVHMNLSDMFTVWAIENFRQFLTLYPHTPDNSFLGHVVDVNLKESLVQHRHTQAVVYGKEGRYFRESTAYLKEISSILPVHVTTKDHPEWMPPELIHHGVLRSTDLHRLLQGSKVFIGLGFPFEGPAPLEALADGCVFLQARFSPAKSYQNNAFFKGKPTHRSLVSQHPYLEEFVGKPYVHTVDMNNLSEVRNTVQEILARNEESFRPFLPYEFTATGFLERIGSFVAFQHFCPSAKDVALGQTATASSMLNRHRADEPVDGVLDSSTCFWSLKETSHWWQLDLGKVFPFHTLRIDNMLDWSTAAKWKETFVAPFHVIIQDAKKRQIISKDFLEQRLFYTWREIGVSGQYVRIESLPSQGAHHLRVKTGHIGKSCADTCQQLDLVLNNQLPCTAYSSGSLSFLPGHIVGFLSGFEVGECATNSEPLLFSCAGKSNAVRRVCPCRPFKLGQVALPPE